MSCSPGELADLLSARDGVVKERSVAPRDGELARFEQAEGPLAGYERVVRVAGGPAGAGGDSAVEATQLEATQVVCFRVGIPYVSWLFALPLLANLAGTTPGGRAPWWAPPQRLDHRGAVALAGLCGFAVLAGYLDGLLPATMTYIGRQYHVGDAGQGYALAVVQLGAVLALGALVLADRKGRRRSVLLATVGGALASMAVAACPSLSAVVAVELIATALLTAQYVLVGVSVVELMPLGARAWALALLTMSYGLGGGATLVALPLAGLGPGGWRWLYLIAAVAAGWAVLLVRHVPETERWRLDATRRARAGAPSAGSDPPPRRRWSPTQRRRLLVLGAGALLFALFATPAAQFQNQYLRVQRHWSAVHISLTEQAVGTAGALGTLPGGRLADTRGRRPVLAFTLVAGTVATLFEYFSGGPSLYGWMAVASFLGYAVTPALAVYGAELFPTSLRARAGGVLNVLGAGGGLAGLALSGALAGALGRLGPALGVVAVGPLLLVVLVLLVYPETAGRSLEDLNPGDPVLDPAQVELEASSASPEQPPRRSGGASGGGLG